MADKAGTLLRKRVFISNVDTYSSKYIAKFLATSTTGTTEDDEADRDATPTLTGENLGFQIVGTVSSRSLGELSFLSDEYRSPSRDQLFGRLLECDVIVYNLSENTRGELLEEATWAITALHAEKHNFLSHKMFILVSSVMTWAMTKPLSMDDLDPPLREDDYRRRRPHPNFKDLNGLEKLVLKLGKQRKMKLIGFVVASGIQYGQGENLLDYFFKTSWSMLLDKVPFFGHGMNYIPMVHVYDLAGIIQNVIELEPKVRYILAVDNSKKTLEDIIQTISFVLGPGKIIKKNKEEAILMKIMEPEELEYLSIDLRLEANLAKDLFSIQWKSEMGMIDNMQRIVEEYKETRQLLPIRIFITGPPTVGKTTVAQKLCKLYQVHHIQLKGVIEEKIKKLEGILEGGEIDKEELIGVAKVQLDMIRNSMKKNKGRLDDHLVFRIMQDKLNSKPCRNQGFVLDDYPKTYEQAKQMFCDEEAETEEVNTKIPSFNKNIIPEHVFVLNATDDFLTTRAQGVPQDAAEAARCTREVFTARLLKYRQARTREETLWDYFDELENHPEHIEVNTDDPEYTEIVERITQLVGKPRSCSPTPEERMEQAQRQEEERQRLLDLEAAERRRRNDAALAELAAQHHEWNRNMAEVKRQQRELMEARSLPLRNYLMKYVMPVLSDAMLDCCKTKPSDPVDYLAEHLRRKSGGEDKQDTKTNKAE